MKLALVLLATLASCSSMPEYPVHITALDAGHTPEAAPNLGPTYPDSAPACQAYCISFGKDFACNQTEKDCITVVELIDSEQEQDQWVMQCHIQQHDCVANCIASCLNCNFNNCCDLTGDECQSVCEGN
jgi:hypothetical protein